MLLLSTNAGFVDDRFERRGLGDQKLQHGMLRLLGGHLFQLGDSVLSQLQGVFMSCNVRTMKQFPCSTVLMLATILIEVRLILQAFCKDCAALVRFLIDISST